jgi:hypothetical protein
VLRILVPRIRIVAMPDPIALARAYGAVVGAAGIVLGALALAGVVSLPLWASAALLVPALLFIIDSVRLRQRRRRLDGGRHAHLHLD